MAINFFQFYDAVLRLRNGAALVTSISTINCQLSQPDIYDVFTIGPTLIYDLPTKKFDWVLGLFIVSRIRKHLKVVFESENTKSAVIQGARSSKPANFYVNECLMQKHSNLLYKLRVMKKQNASPISFVYFRNRTACIL